MALTISFTYTTPKFEASGLAMKALSQVVRDWQVGGVLRYQSGALIATPLSNNQLGAQLVHGINGVGTTTYFNVNPGQQPLLVNPNCGCFNPQTTQVLNPAAWTDAPAGQWGTSAPYYSGYRWQRQPAESLSLARNFRMGKEGKYTLQVRAELYNVFNRLFLSAPSTTNPSNPALTVANGVVTGGYGSVATAGGVGATPRNGQLVARFRF
jgi:hypothetical protein